MQLHFVSHKGVAEGGHYLYKGGCNHFLVRHRLNSHSSRQRASVSHGMTISERVITSSPEREEIDRSLED